MSIEIHICKYTRKRKRWCCLVMLVFTPASINTLVMCFVLYGIDTELYVFGINKITNKETNVLSAVDVGSHFDCPCRRFQTCVLVGKFSWNMKSIGIQSVVQYRICPVRFGMLTILLRFWTNICPCWLDVMYQLRTSVSATRISLDLIINAGVLLTQAEGSSSVVPWSFSG